MSFNYKSHWKHPPRIRSSSSNNAAADPDLHARKEKRLQIADPETIQVPRSDAPKTSEFAYFKKFKKDLGCASSSRSLNRSENLKTGQSNGLDFESTVAAKGFEDLSRNIRASFQAETRVPADQSLFLSPPRIDVDNYAVENKKAEPQEIKHSSFHFSGNISNGSQDLFSSPFAGVATKVSGNQSADDGIFSKKRKKLRQCVAESFKDVGVNVNSKGFDLISTLLSRLFPPKDETKCYQQFKSKERVIGAVDCPPASTEPYNFEKSCTVFASASNAGSLWDDVLPAPRSYRPKHKDLPEWDMIASGFRQTNYDFEVNLQDYEGDRLQSFDRENSVKFLCADNDDSSFARSHELHSNGLRLREYNDFYYPDKPLRKKPCNLLLSLDDEDNKEKSLSKLRNVGYHQIVHDTLDEASPAQLSVWPRQSMEYPDFHLTNAYMHEPWNIQKEDYAIEVAKQFRQHLPSPPRYLTWEEDSDIPKDLNDSLTDFSRGMPDDLNYSLNGLSRDTHNDLNYSLTDPSRDMPDDLKYSLNGLNRDTPSDLSYSLIDISPDTPSNLSYSLTDLSYKESVFETVCFSRRLNTDLSWECLPVSDLFSNCSSNNQIFGFPWKEDHTSYTSDNNEIRLNDSNSREICLPSSYNVLDSHWNSTNAMLLDYPCRIRDREYCLNNDNSKLPY